MSFGTDTGYAPDRWAFDEEVARVFPDMFERSIPDLAGLRRRVLDYGTPFVTEGSSVLDLGCSHGTMLRSLARAISLDNVHYVGLDSSEPMIGYARRANRAFTAPRGRLTATLYTLTPHTRFQSLIDERPSLIVSLMTTMFLDRPTRRNVLDQAALALGDRGALILAEKIKLTGKLAIIEAERYFDFKLAKGYTRDDILRKNKSLAGVLVPRRADRTDLNLRARFEHVDCFWAAGPFRAWIATNES